MRGRERWGERETDERKKWGEMGGMTADMKGQRGRSSVT